MGRGAKPRILASCWQSYHGIRPFEPQLICLRKQVLSAKKHRVDLADTSYAQFQVNVEMFLGTRASFYVIDHVQRPWVFKIHQPFRMYKFSGRKDFGE